MDKMGALDHSDVKFMYFYMVLVDSAQQILKRKDKVISCSCVLSHISATPAAWLTYI